MPSKKVHTRTERAFQKWFVEQMVGDGYDPFAEAHWFWDLQTKYQNPANPRGARMTLDRGWAWRQQMQQYCMMKKILLMEHTGEDRDV